MLVIVVGRVLRDLRRFFSSWRYLSVLLSALQVLDVEEKSAGESCEES